MKRFSKTEDYAKGREGKIIVNIVSDGLFFALQWGYIYVNMLGGIFSECAAEGG